MQKIIINDKRRTYTLHFNAVSSDRPDMFYDKVRGLQCAIEACDALMNGPCPLVPSRMAGIKAWVCATVKAPSPWNPSKIVEHGIAVYSNFDPEPTSTIIHSNQAAKHGLVFKTNRK